MMQLGHFNTPNSGVTQVAGGPLLPLSIREIKPSKSHRFSGRGERRTDAD